MLEQPVRQRYLAATRASEAPIEHLASNETSALLISMLPVILHNYTRLLFPISMAASMAAAFDVLNSCLRKPVVLGAHTCHYHYYANCLQTRYLSDIYLCMLHASLSPGTFNDNSEPTSHEILMFVCLQKDAKRCCDVTKLGCTQCSGRSSTDQSIEYNQAL